MFIDALTAALIALSIMLALLAAAGALLLPVRSRGISAELVARVESGADCPERTLGGLMFIAKLAGVRVRIECGDADAGTVDEIRKFLRGHESEMYISEGEPNGRENREYREYRLRSGHERGLPK